MKKSVLKFGGSSFIDHNSYLRVAEYIDGRVSRGEKVAVVVSAMSGTTGRLKEAVIRVNPAYSGEVGDLLLATGEIVSCCMLRAACEKRGLSVGALTGFQAGIETDREFGRASVTRIDPGALNDLIAEKDVVVLCGGQAVTDDHRLTMLGRNSSDLTAILVAHALGVEGCEIFSDVPGIYSSDPHWVPPARCLPEVSYASAIAMSRMGAKVLHHGCVVTAERMGIAIHCRMMDREGRGVTGTVIGRGRDASAVVIAKDAMLMHPREAGGAEALRRRFDAGNLNHFTLGSDLFLLDASLRGGDLKRLGEMAAIEMGYLVSLSESGSVTAHEFLPREREAREAANRFHRRIEPGGPSATATIPREKRRSGMSELLTLAS